MRVVWQMLAISAIAALAAWSTRAVIGPINREVVCDPASLKPGEICYRTVIEKWQGKVIWVDARRKEDWQRDGIAGSVWITHENFDASLSEVAPRMMEGLPVIVYCSDVGCGTSLEVANRIRAFQLSPEVHALHGGWKVLQQELTPQ